MIVFADGVMMPGVTVWRSISRRAGDETSAIAIEPVPLGQPVAGGTGTAGTTAVWADVAEVEPPALVAVTLTRSVVPTSTCCRT